MSLNLLDDNSLEQVDAPKIYPSKGERFGAAFIDNIVITIITSILGLLLGGDGSIVSIFVTSLTYPIYKILMEGNSGQTIGKQFTSIRVVKDDGQFTPITIADAISRFMLWMPMYLGLLAVNVLNIAGLEGMLLMLASVFMLAGLCLYLGSVLSIFASDRGKTWHDRVGKTICVKMDTLKQ
ncbi:MAG: RDD family protein [Aureispira sp.]